MKWGLLKGKLAKKVFILFILASFIPLLLASALAYYQANKIIQADSLYNLQSAAKEYGLSLFFKLKLAKDTLINHENNILKQQIKNQGSSLYNYFSSIAIKDKHSSIQILWGDISPSIFEAGGENKSSLFTIKRSNNKKDAYININGKIIGKINSKYLWDTETQITENNFCIIDNKNEKIFCQENINKKEILEISNSPKNKTKRKIIIKKEKGELIATYWSLFMDHEFGTDDWKIITIQNNNKNKESLIHFKKTFITLILFSLCLVILLSSILIRKNLKAIEKIIEGTRNIIKGNFKHNIEIKSNDEFSELAQSFNIMANNMESIINEYQAFSEIDRLIIKSEEKEKIIFSIFNKISSITNLKSLILINKEKNNLGLLNIYKQKDDIYLKENNLDTYKKVNDLEITKTLLLNTFDIKIYRSIDNNVCIIPIIIDQNRKDISYIIGYTDEEKISELEKNKLDVFSNRIAIIFQAMARESLLRYKANHDLLTGLPNRNKVLSLYKSPANQQEQTHSALLFLDLDHFKQVNDNYGHFMGDKLLIEFSMRIRSITNDNDMIARLGGDEFIILLNSPNKKNLKNRVEKVCARIINSVKQAFYIDNHVLHIGTSIGVTIGLTHEYSFDDAIRHADIAMYFSKKNGGNGYTIYSKEMSDDLLKRTLLERDLRAALDNDEINVHFQPKFNAANNKLSGFEALFRWEHEHYGNISPFVAIEIAESIGLITDLGGKVFEKSIRQWQLWLEAGYDIGTIAINISPVQLLDPNFINFVSSTIDKSPLVEENMVELEVTESVMLEDKTLSIAALQSLRDIGISIAIDDFGTGYSSLSYLLDLPASTLKIDRAFVIKIEQDKNALALLGSVISLGKSMNYKIVAEGVETNQQADFLRQCNADELQGYLFSKPLPAEQIEKRFLSNLKLN